MYSPNIKNFLNLLEVESISTQSHCHQSKDKKVMKQKSIRKNRHLKKTRTLKNKKQKNKVETKSSIQFSQQNLDISFHQISSKQYKQQINQLKKIFIQTEQQFYFQDQDIKDFQEIIEGIVNFVPISIDRLFDQFQTSLFKTSYDLNDLLRYFKLLYKSEQQKQRKIILTYQGQTLYLTKQSGRQQNHHQYKGTFIQRLQDQVFQNRADFMEKIKINQSKYQHSGSHLTQVSQQLLFLSKVYMENSSKLKKIIQNLNFQAKLKSQQNQQQKSMEKLYYEIVISKNIRYAFSNQKIDFFNYFIQKQIEQNNIDLSIPKIHNHNQLIDYLKTKKTKRNKSPLPTACSCCFSGYYENYNPLLTCEGCNLRCHKLCLDLKQDVCGNCSYQRISKTNKENIDFCLICKQKGEMTIKVGPKSYAHPFCLLFHKLWQIGNFSKNNQNLLKQQNKCLNSTQNTGWKVNTSPQKSTIIYFDMTKIQKLGSSSPCQSENRNQNIRFDHGQNCGICSKQLIKKLRISCMNCSKQYHAFCAFFEGFQFIKNQGNEQKALKNICYSLNCCKTTLQENQYLKKKRHFTLNKNRYLFEGL